MQVMLPVKRRFAMVWRLILSRSRRMPVLGPPEVDLSRSEIAEALVIASMVVVLDEGRDLAFEIAG